jgi:hypothetical protein
VGPLGPTAIHEVVVDVLQTIHRHADGAITFHRKKGSDFENLFALQARHLPQLLPKVQDQLLVNAYASLNAFWCADDQPHTLPAARIRKRQYLRFLCTCFCDLDGYNAGLSPAELLDRVGTLEKRGEIPRISGHADSGRGLWVFWLLHDRDDPTMAQRAFPEKIRLYEAIQHEFHRRLRHLFADAKDVLRVARVPGSMNTKSGTLAHYDFRRSNGAPLTYTLADLATQLGIELKPPPRRDARTQGKVPNRKRGYDALAARRLREFERLWTIRGNFRQGCRNHAVFVYAWLLRCNRHTTAAAEIKILEFGRDCRPPLAPSECRNAVKSAYKPAMRKMRDATISDFLGITPDEAAMLEKLPPASCYSSFPPPTSAPKVDRSVIGERRREQIAEQIRKLGRVPTTREMARLLCTVGSSVSHVLVASDYKKLQVKSES